MWAHIEFWLAKTLAELVTLGIVFVVLFVVLLLLALPRAIKQWRCKHDGSIHETQACDAICSQCGANLGFIGSWRERHKKS